MDSTRPDRHLLTRLRFLWQPYLWLPCLVLIIGLVTTGVTASLVANQVQGLAEQAYHARHDALIHRLHARAAAQSPDDQVGQWLASLFPPESEQPLAVRVDTLERHSKTPLFQTRASTPLDGSLSLRSELNLPEHRWLITTMPDMAMLRAEGQQARQVIWLAGALMTALAMALSIGLSIRLYRLRAHLQAQQTATEKLEQQYENGQVEKSILRQALNDSELRSRDLVALSGAIIGELDEQGRIGYISAEVAEWLDRAPADLAGTPFSELVSDHYRVNLERTLDAARTEKAMQRIDLDLLPAQPERQRVPVTLRVLALRDPLHGFTGYRLSANPGMLVRGPAPQAE